MSDKTTITVGPGHAIVVGTPVYTSNDTGAACVVTCITSTTIVIREATRRDRLRWWCQDQWCRVRRVFWRIADAVVDWS